MRTEGRGNLGGCQLSGGQGEVEGTAEASTEYPRDVKKSYFVAYVHPEYPPLHAKP